MSSSLDPDAVEIIVHHHNEYGPGDTSDSASDVGGSELQESDTSTGTGERSSAESVAPSETEHDISPDEIISLLEQDNIPRRDEAELK